MLESLKARAKGLALQATTVYLNSVYQVASMAQRSRLQELAALHPESLVTPPELIERQTAARLVPTLQHTIYDLTNKGTVVPFQTLQELVERGLRNGLFENFGEAIYIKKSRAKDLLEALDLDPGQTEQFIDLASKHGLIRKHVYANQLSEALFLKYRHRGESHYGERTYTVTTRDGFHQKLVRLVNFGAVRVGDNSPNVLYIAGTACNELYFDLNDETSLALDTADHGSWVYLCAQRGLGRNKGEFDHHSTIDTEVSNELPAYVDYIYHRSKQKPVILIGHSKGGFNALFMAVRQAFKLQEALNKITSQQGLANFNIRGRSREEIQQFLNSQNNKEETRSLVEEAQNHLDLLKMIKGIITLGSPLAFDKKSHPIFPLFLTLNVLLPTFGEEAVPVDKGKWLAKTFPSLAKIAKMLINPQNFDNPEAYIRELTAKGIDSFPLGVGFQMLKAIYSGRGIRRMTEDKFEYAKHLDLIPVDVPIYMLVGDQDILCPPPNLGFIDPAYAKGSRFKLARFSRFQHQRQVVHEVASREDVDQLNLYPQASQVVGIKIAGINHLDYFDGTTGQEVGRPLLQRLIQNIWAA